MSTLHDATDVERASQKEAYQHVEVTKEEAIVDTDAAGYVDSSVVIDANETKRLRRLINRRVLPCMIACYLCQTMDKGSFGAASIMGYITDTKMHGQDYALTSTLFWVGVIAGEIPANRLVQILPLGKLVGACLFVWGLILFIIAFMKNWQGQFALRIVLGLVESISGPVLLALSVMWYRKAEQPLVVSTYQCSIGATSILTGALGYGFYHVVDKPLKGWQYMMILIACCSMITGVVVGYVLPDSPPKAKCFSETDKLLMVERVRLNDQGIKNTRWNQQQVYEALKDPLVYLFFILLVLNTMITGGLGTFANLLINQAFGFDAAHSQLLTMPQGTLSILLLLSSAWAAKRTNQTLLVIFALTIPNIVGTIVLITVTPSPTSRGGLVAAFYLMQCFQAQSPLIMSLVGRNFAGQSKKVAAYAFAFVAWAGGNAIGSQIFQAKWAPRYLPTLYCHLGIYAAFIVLVFIIRVLLVFRNKKKVKERGDLSSAQIGHAHSRAFDDLTDMQNPEFSYSV